MSQDASDKDQRVDIVKNEDDVSQQPLSTGGQPQDAQAGAEAPSYSTEPSTTGNVATGQKKIGQKKEDIGVVVSEKKDAPPLPQGQPMAKGDPPPPVVGVAIAHAKAPVANTPQVETYHATTQVTITSSSKDNNPRQALPSDGLLQLAPSSSSLEDGKLVAGETRKVQATETNFPMKLYDMLSNPDNHHAIAWMPHGRAWKVRQKDVFMRTTCPQYFSQTKFESFIRQANGWGFRRIRKEGPDRNAYYHGLFLRGQPELLEDMRRPLPGEKAAQEVVDPNFYNLPVLPQIPYGYDQSSSKQVSFASPSKNEGKRKKKRKTDSNKVGSSPESAFSNPYGGHGGPDPHWYGMPPPPPSPWGVPYAYSQQQQPEFGYGMPPPPPPPQESAAAWQQQPSPSTQESAAAWQQPSPSHQHHEQGMPGTPGTNMPPPQPQNDMPPFNPSYYFPPYYSPYPPPPPPHQMNQAPNQYQTNVGANDESNMNRTPDGQIMPPPPPPEYQYPPYPPPPPHQYHGDVPYYPPPDDMPYNPPPEAGPYHYGYQQGPFPPNSVPVHPNPNTSSQGNGNGQGGLDIKREEDSFQFSPIHHQDES